MAFLEPVADIQTTTAGFCDDLTSSEWNSNSVNHCRTTKCWRGQQVAFVRECLYKQEYYSAYTEGKYHDVVYNLKVLPNSSKEDKNIAVNTNAILI